MAPTDYNKVMRMAYPLAQWTLQDPTDFETLAWCDTNQLGKPTLQEALAKFEEERAKEAMKLLRIKRNKMLATTDFVVLPDYPCSDEASKQAWLAYRQALRDITKTAKECVTLDWKFSLDDSLVEWPERPGPEQPYQQHFRV